MRTGHEGDPSASQTDRFYKRKTSLLRGASIGAAGTVAAASIAIAAWQFRDSLPLPEAHAGTPATQSDNLRVVEVIPQFTQFKEEALPQEVLSRLLKSVKRIQTTVPKQYQQYGYKGGDCTGFVVRGQDGSASILTAQHCAPEVIRDQNGVPTKTRMTDGTSILQVKAIMGPATGTVDLKPVQYYSLQDRPLIDVYDVVRMKSAAQEKFNDIQGIKVPESQSLEPGQRLTLLSIDAKGNPTAGLLYYIGSDIQGGLTLLALNNLDQTCIVGQSGSAIVDSKGNLAGVFTNTEASPIQLSLQELQKYNLSPNLLGTSVKICYAVGLSGIKGVIEN